MSSGQLDLNLYLSWPPDVSLWIIEGYVGMMGVEGTSDKTAA